VNKTRQLLENLVGHAKPVIVKVVPQEILICPHCNETIHEKSLRAGDSLNETYHGPCNGLIKLPGPSDEQLEFLKQKWGIEIKVPINEGDGQPGYDVPPNEETKELAALQKADALLQQLISKAQSVPGYQRRAELVDMARAISTLIRDAQGLPHHETFASKMAKEMGMNLSPPDNAGDRANDSRNPPDDGPRGDFSGGFGR